MLAFLFVLVSSKECEYFQCEESSDSIPINFVNDNYCDCPDGSDEPLTSACANSVFSCGERKIPSSWVGDSICGNF